MPNQLRMMYFPDDRAPPGLGMTPYRLGSDDLSDVSIPNNEILKEKWEEIYGKDKAFEVISRSRNHILMAIPTGTKKSQARQAFVDRVSALTTY